MKIGRKKTGDLVQVTLLFDREVLKSIDQECEKSKMSRGRLLTQLFQEKYKVD